MNNNNKEVKYKHVKRQSYVIYLNEYSFQQYCIVYFLICHFSITVFICYKDVVFAKMMLRATCVAVLTKRCLNTEERGLYSKSINV